MAEDLGIGNSDVFNLKMVPAEGFNLKLFQIETFKQEGLNETPNGECHLWNIPGQF